MLKANHDLALKLRKELHRHPELSGEERWTKQHLLTFFREKTSLEVHDRGRWFFAVYRGTGDTKIAFRADFDAIRMEEGLDIEHKSQNKGVEHAAAVAQVMSSQPELPSSNHGS